MRDEPSKKIANVNDNLSEVVILLQGIANKDSASLECLYDTYSGMLMSVISSVINVRAEAEDVLQEVFLTIWNKADQYKPHLGKPVSWMVTVAKNKAYDRYRSLVRKTEGQAKIKQEIEVTKQNFVGAKGFKNEAITEAMSLLSDDQREAIELIYYQGLTQKEVAEQLDTPLGTIKARTRRGLLALKENYNLD